MRRSFLALLALICIPFAACGTAKAMTLDEMSVVEFADSIHIKVPLSLPVGADSAHVTLTLTPGGAQTRTAVSLATALTFAFVKPAVKISFQACGIVYDNGVPGASTCNTAQTWTPATGVITWPDTMQVSQMVWPDSASTELVAMAEADAMPSGNLNVVTGEDTVQHLQWARWGNALITLGSTTQDTARWSFDRRNWDEIREEAIAFANSPNHRLWWDSVKTCLCRVYWPLDPNAPGYKS